MNHLLSHIRNEIKAHSFDYLILILGAMLFLSTLSVFKGDRWTQFLTTLVFVGSYIVWGIYHHAHAGRLHLKTVIEYILIGFTIIFLLKLLILPN
ncbi:hypothetical protein A2866_05110 [Candidatus Roizmanbacteria bacterium RIFCSPHIGHO2_01_FULL_39_8]|uniref:Uncharacterized protein n=3 Tax=Candidatus Roizmaniibacteriota TaxID=1752723 RepID=A0A1F7GH53_9BACT|nr:MAG: hypothetical protein A2866_05110 [Candidatus Roizmanbacteria bacterium RIFCSPHIGHO2_01_FULL_39_8]OGK28466.1 MAG: hypothetical protein A3C28_04095 [Candidatus Roizmanbacteria bacterium RIFCSPHIGHO2_02_FULL_39_9]OGK36581.1 MAG: hypothetical protein A3F60_00980 [Candidatus Roizmanbacteria bacterium RIFCSPHIGHO2_12_FULL_39_8]